MEFHTRRLPHWTPEGKPLFLTWALHGVLPHNRFPPPGSPSAGKAFVWMDRYLDEAPVGPRHLIRAGIAAIVTEAIHYAADRLRYYDLGAYVVMPNHVHMLVLPRVDPGKLQRSVKGYSAYEANKILGQAGESFWQNESYDHWVRDPAEFQRIRHYIENNPVRAYLAKNPDEYRWSSAWKRS